MTERAMFQLDGLSFLFALTEISHYEFSKAKS